MKNELKLLLKETLEENRIKFDLCYVQKGCIVELGIGDKKNEECGIVYDELSEWLSYGEFIDYLIHKGVNHNINGEIYLENNEICFVITLGNYYGFDDFETKYIELNEDFILNKLEIDLSNLGLEDSFEEHGLSLMFHKEKDSPIEQLELFNNKNLNKIELDKKQLKTLIDFLESEISKEILSFDIEFECEILWTLECEDNYLNFNYSSTDIKLRLNEIIPN